jgi:uncharacterized membrane protein YhaH (DUF805 family)
MPSAFESLLKPSMVWRLTLFLSAVTFLLFGVSGVTSAQRMGSDLARVHIPDVLYALTIGTCLPVASLAFLLPDRLLLARRGLCPAILLGLAMLSGFTAPLIYVHYDFDARLVDTKSPVPSAPP